jgi:hypothetical protein
MEQNKAIKNALKARRSVELPYGFENQIMRRVYVEAEKKRKRSFVTGIGLISFVSVLMITATIYLLKIYFAFKLQVHLPEVTVTSESLNVFGFSCYIAALVLALLGLDTYFRKLRQKRQEKHS